MKYDSTSIIDRRVMDALAVDNVGKKMWGNEPDAPKEGFSIIPMWIADMNFGGTCHIRINFASPFSMIKEACDCLKKYVFTK